MECKPSCSKVFSSSSGGILALFYFEKKGNYVQRGERLPREIVKTAGVRINKEIVSQIPPPLLANDYENLRVFFLGGPGSIEEN